MKQDIGSAQLDPGGCLSSVSQSNQNEVHIVSEGEGEYARLPETLPDEEKPLRITHGLLMGFVK